MCIKNKIIIKLSYNVDMGFTKLIRAAAIYNVFSIISVYNARTSNVRRYIYIYHNANIEFFGCCWNSIELQ